ncbi:hypothetical protein, partial [Pseudomonas poae]|uniref:hypothetical protein n=1 Tax=Pseudomonas poae TaxID=200451 RepID=UPI0034D4A3B8
CCAAQRRTSLLATGNLRLTERHWGKPARHDKSVQHKKPARHSASLPATEQQLKNIAFGFKPFDKSPRVFG